MSDDDILLKGVSLLQPFNLSNAGGIERVLQIASDLSHRRSRESIAWQANPTFRGRFGVNMWKELTHQRLPSNGNSTGSGNETDSENLDASAASRNSSLVSKITSTVWKGITNQTAMQIPPSPTIPTSIDIPEPEVESQTTSNLWSYAEKLKSSDTIATLSKMSSNWRARALLSSTSRTSPQPTNIPQNSSRDLRSGSHEHDSSRTSSSLSMHSMDLPVEMASEGSSQQSNTSLLDKTRSLLSPTRSPPPAPKSAPRPLLLTSTLATSGQNRHRNLINSTITPDPVEWGDVMREKQHYMYRDSLSSTSSLSPSERYVRTPKSAKSDRESDTSSSRIVRLNRQSISPMAPNFRSAHERLRSRTSSASSGFRSPPILPRQTTDARIASGSPTASQSYPPLSDYNANRIAALDPKESNDSDTASRRQPTSFIRPTESENAELKPYTSIEEKTFDSAQLTVEWPRAEIEMVSTPKGSRFESEEHVPVPRKLSRSPFRSRKLATEELERQRKVSVDTIRDYRQRKVSNPHRPHKISTENKEIHKRDSSAEEGDDEGYDELLSAYESEGGPRSSLE